MQVKINYTGQTQFQIYGSSHVIWSDQPFTRGGTDAGMTPEELLLSAVGSSVGAAAVAYCQKANLDPAGLAISVFGQVEEGPHRLDHLRLDLHFPEAFEPEAVAGIQQAIQESLIFNTLKHGTKISIEVMTEALKLPQTTAVN